MDNINELLLEKLKWSWPPALIKALVDPFYYEVKLHTGEQWYIKSAQYLNDDYACLTLHPDWSKAPYFERGVEVRISNIAWIADTPKGPNNVSL